MRWAVPAGVINICHVAGEKNLADILSKHWDLPSVRDTMKPLLFWHLNSNVDSQEELDEVNQKEDVGKLASDEDVNDKLDAAILAQMKGDYGESQPHQGE